MGIIQKIIEDQIINKLPKFLRATFKECSGSSFSGTESSSLRVEISISAENLKVGEIDSILEQNPINGVKMYCIKEYDDELNYIGLLIKANCELSSLEENVENSKQKN